MVISKIYNTKKQSLLAFEMKGYRGDITSKEDYDKGLGSLQKVTGYLKLFGTMVNN
jgi:hypothetical protein